MYLYTRIKTLSMCLVFAATCGLAYAESPDTAVKPENNKKYSINKMRAYLYFQEEGVFGNDDIASTDTILRNVVISNSGVVGDNIKYYGPSANFIVFIDVLGDGFVTGNASGYQISIQATSDGKVINYLSVDLTNYFSEKHQISIPFIVYKTGCAPIIVKAIIKHNNTIIDENKNVYNF